MMFVFFQVLKILNFPLVSAVHVGAHCIFLASNLKQRVLYVYDPMGQDSSYHRKQLKNWKGFWRHHLPSSSQKWRVVSSPYENQEDGNNCGILVLKILQIC
uniref:uncharacterized protein LOC108950842 isoform X2 n=1 Tax=Ciona intestinalis TaxID=7719 RepID=UPI00089DBD91|nr:uncharacterized protein LOC108950842 isoform X2 [Ciona intestinalis]|eukprot:XP_018672515.1 uncharacterized protein LOC108950842 isoform X2 [Ciona intestinalis]